MSRPACTSRSHPLSRKPRSEPTDGSPDGEPVGPLTPLLERYRGRNLPQACAGFGLPKIYEELSHALGRPIPTTETEATAVSEWLAQHGPFEPNLFPLWRRIRTKVTLTGLRRGELDRFLVHCLGKEDAARFEPPALDAIFEQGRGIPALLYALAEECLRTLPSRSPAPAPPASCASPARGAKAP